jgi:hypothetical protein
LLYNTMWSGSSLLLASNNGKEHVKGDLDRIDKDQTMLGGDELEVDGMDDRPNLPRSLAGRQQVTLNLLANSTKRVAIDQTQVGEKDGHENGAPE